GQTCFMPLASITSAEVAAILLIKPENLGLRTTGFGVVCSK
ncbi:MAG: hypothetical protein ACI9I4_001758, partial [Neolewinella sp.]